MQGRSAKTVSPKQASYPYTWCTKNGAESALLGPWQVQALHSINVADSGKLIVFDEA